MFGSISKVIPGMFGLVSVFSPVVKTLKPTSVISRSGPRTDTPYETFSVSPRLAGIGGEQAQAAGAKCRVPGPERRSATGEPIVLR